jgi:spore germination protein GerM
VKRLAVILLGIALTACGVPSNTEPHAIDRDDVPFQLLAPTASVTSTTMPSGSTGTQRISIYLADAEGHLVSTHRQVPQPATAAAAVSALLRGPIAEESGRLSTAITSGTRLLGVDGPTNGLVTIDLSRELLDITGRQQILALAEVVFTATSLPDVDRVRFKIAGKRREVSNGDGTLTAEPLGRNSYRTLVNG